MKARIYFLSLLFIASGVFFTSCDDDEDEEEPAPQEQSTEVDNVPNLPMADGALIAVDTKTTQELPIGGTIDIVIGTGVGVFFDANDGFVNVGTVTLNSSQLTRNANNSYTYIPTISEPTGINFNGGTDWEVSGDNGFPAIMASPGFPFPDVGNIGGADMVDTSQDYKIMISSVSDADSIIYNISGVLKTLAGNETSCTFSAAEISSLASGPGIIQAAAYSYESDDFGGKTIYFVKETVVSKSVTIE